jgi:hypothetical protein
MLKPLFLLALLLSGNLLSAQSPFPYRIQLDPVNINGLSGLHSYAFAHHHGEWLFIGGRLDGIHARQPFNAFPASMNNTLMRVLNPTTGQSWSMSVDSLSVAIREQFQSTNLNYFQNGDSLVLVGGYGYSPTAGDHITHPRLSVVSVSGLIGAIKNNRTPIPHVLTLNDSRFAVTGGQLGKLGENYVLVGGHRFDGRYNPMNGPSFTQTYTNEIRRFSIHQANGQLSVVNYQAQNDLQHLHRRDFNLIPQRFADGRMGYMLSTGVFQQAADLPFLYNVDIDATAYRPRMAFQQLLSHYHSAHFSFFDSTSNHNHTIFFGGMAQYFYQNDSLVQDNRVPFVNTISRVSRAQNDSLSEAVLPITMPALLGASAEFIPNEALNFTPSELLLLGSSSADTLLVGHIYGGLSSASPNPFSFNQTNTTSAASSLYAVRLIRNQALTIQPMQQKLSAYDFKVYPNPVKRKFTVEFRLEKIVPVRFQITDTTGKIILKGSFEAYETGLNEAEVELPDGTRGTLLISLVFDKSQVVTKRIQTR